MFHTKSSNMKLSPGMKFKLALENKKPLHIVGTVNAFTALLAEECGHEAIYLSGSGVATASFGLPDLGMTNLCDVLEDARRITSCCGLPLLVDVDTGFGGVLGVMRCVKEMERVGVAAIHIEDQIQSVKRCGHLPNKQIVGVEEMVEKIKAACQARIDSDFVIIARTDALAVEGLEKAIERAKLYVQAGADMLFPEACTTLEEYRAFVQQVGVPILANITEFGKTPLFTGEQLASVGVSMVLHPLSAFRAMAKAALGVYQSISNNGTVEPVLDTMQTRSELYDIIGYKKYEDKMEMK